MTWIPGQVTSPATPETKAQKCPAGVSECPVYRDYLSLKKDHQRLKQLSIKDELTGYYNYSFIVTALDNEMERTRRSGLPCCIILADIDHFKIINDRFGHESGNIALETVTRLWKQNIRQVDYPCRYGGEELLFILPNEKLVNAIQTAERLRKILEKHPLYLKKQRIRLTASFGVYEYNGVGHHSPGELIEKVDRFLYQAKHAGRNRTCPDGPPPRAESQQLSLAERMALYK